MDSIMPNVAYRGMSWIFKLRDLLVPLLQLHW